MNVKLFIEIYEKNGDKFIQDIYVSSYNLSVLKEICPPEEEGDINYCNGLFVEEYQFKKMKEIILELAELDYENYDYNLISRWIWRK
jgi:hypothetical protein